MRRFFRELFCKHNWNGGFVHHPFRYEATCTKCGKKFTYL